MDRRSKKYTATSVRSVTLLNEQKMKWSSPMDKKGRIPGGDVEHLDNVHLAGRTWGEALNFRKYLLIVYESTPR